MNIQPKPESLGLEFISKADYAPQNTIKWPEPTKENYEVVFKPYGDQGKGFYQKPIDETSPKWMQPASVDQPVAEPQPTVRICAWCDKDKASTKAALARGYTVTHGICPKCIADLKKGVAAK